MKKVVGYIEGFRNMAVRGRTQKLRTLIPSSDKEALAFLRACISPASFWPPEQIPPHSAWLEHAPFAFWLMDVLRPRTFVELGTHSGFSYFAFCQAVQRLQLKTCCYAVDSWRGDEHAGFYGEEVFGEVSNQNDRRYSAFSSLIRSSFDDASRHFADGSIELLHIDGRHFFDDVKHDFETWRPKLSDRGVVLFHDTNVRERDFGVFRLWNELRRGHPYFEFPHGHGLGVLGIGKELPEQILALFAAQASVAASSYVQRAYSRLGSAVTFQFRAEHLQLTTERQIAALNNALIERDAKATALDLALSERNKELAALQQALTERDAKTTALDLALSERNKELAALPVHLALTPGEAHDNRLCSALLSALLPQTMLLADRGYDADWIRELARQKGAWANIPPKRNRKDPICFSPYLYRARNLIERFFNKIKQCRRVATRYDKLAAIYLAFIKLASIRIWLRANESTA